MTWQKKHRGVCNCELSYYRCFLFLFEELYQKSCEVLTWTSEEVGSENGQREVRQCLVRALKRFGEGKNLETFTKYGKGTGRYEKGYEDEERRQETNTNLQKRPSVP